MGKIINLEYHEICLWSPYYEDTVDKIADNMSKVGFDEREPITLYEGKILDGRHRYLAAFDAEVDPIFQTFEGTKEEAIDYVTRKQVDRNHWSNREKEFFYVQRANALGVRDRGGNGNNQYQSGNPQNCGIAPTASDHADSIGVHVNTVTNWEKDRKEINSDPDLAALATTADGYKDAKQKLKEKRDKINNSVAPDVIDLGAIAKDKKDSDIRKIGPAFIAQMEILCTKFDEKDIKRELAAFMYPDPLGLKTEAIHKMADILSDLREDFQTAEKKQLN
jgi:transcriptional regulator with XRE-family HTH domain